MYRFIYRSDYEDVNEQHTIESSYEKDMNISELFTRFIWFLLAVTFPEEAIKKEVKELAEYFENGGNIFDLT